ncbi:uncharacterized protein [Tursiops truncatus]|uniref:Translation initiation factor IF-2-like n=1 Tax=Tursiops truncatus TaxID=9739 RepID=A0A6J3R1F3_TURTR|nr:translation initiation factor IF-2-like [Tursiops truncatus]XP_033708393.1 translation initiation factor IF-2-like [Tursiops truncatus]
MENRGFGPHSPAAAGDWRGGARSPPSGHSEPPGGGRPNRSAPLSLALLNTPWPTWRTLKLHCALFSQPQPFPTLHRAAARARGGGGGAGSRPGAGTERASRQPPAPGPAPRAGPPGPRPHGRQQAGPGRAGPSDAGGHGRPPRPARPLPAARARSRPAPLADRRGCREATAPRAPAFGAARRRRRRRRRRRPGHLSLPGGPARQWESGRPQRGPARRFRSYDENADGIRGRMLLCRNFYQPLSLRLMKLWIVFDGLRVDPVSVPIIALRVNRRRPTLLQSRALVGFFFFHPAFYRPALFYCHRSKENNYYWTP